VPVIEYEELEFENGYIYRSCKVPFIGQGLTLVRGLNLDDDNFLGAGKSSIFEVFSQVQYGKGGKVDFRLGDHRVDLVNSFSDEGFRASLKLRIDGHPYEIIQYRNHSHYKNKYMVMDRETGEDVFPRDIRVRRSPFKWVRTQFTRMDETSFFNLVYLAQEANNVMIHGRESERRKRLTVMFNLDIYDELQQSVKKTIDLHTTTIADMERIEDELEDVNANLYTFSDIEEVKEELDVARANLKQTQATVNEEMAEYKGLVDIKAQVETRRDLIKEVRELFASVSFADVIDKPQDITDDYVEELRRKSENTHASYVEKKHALERLRRRSVVKEQLKKISAREYSVVQKELSTVKSQIKELQHTELPQAEERVELESDIQRIGKPNTDLSVLEEEYQQSIRSMARLENEIDALNSQVSTAVCPTCHRPYDDMDDATIRDKKEELSGLRDQLEETVQYKNNVSKKMKHCKRYSELRKRLNNIATTRSPSEIQDEINRFTVRERNLMAELEEAQRKIRLDAQLIELPQEREDVLYEEVARLQKLSHILQRRYEAAHGIMERAPKILSLPKGNIEDMRRRLAELEKRLRRASNFISDATDKVNHLSDRVDEYRKLQHRKSKLKKSLEEQEAILQEVACLKALKKAFEPKGLKQDRFQAILRDASQRTVPLYSSLLWPKGTISLGLSEKEGSLHFELTRKRSGVITASSQLSGGEKHKSGLAFLFGMRDLKELYTGSRTNVLIVDEPFGGLDPQGTESLLSILEMLKSRFDSIFVISHRPEVIEHPAWDNIWWAIRENDNATLWRKRPPERYLRLAAELLRR